MILEVASDIAVPFLMSKIVDIGIVNLDKEYIIKTGIFMILIAFFGMFFGVLSSHFGAKAGFGMGSDIREATFKKIQNLSFAKLNKFSKASLITRLTNDCTVISRVGMMTLRMAIRSPFMLLFALIMAFSINKKLSLIFLIIIPIITFFIVTVLKKARPLFKKAQEKIDNLNLVIQENLIGIKVVKSFNRQSVEEKKFKDANEDFQKTTFKAIKNIISILPMLNLAIYTTIIAVLWTGSYEISSGVMGKGQLISFITYSTQVLISLMMMTVYFTNLMRAITSYGRVTEVINTSEDMHISKNPIKSVSGGDILFKDVYFCYPFSSSDCLENINLNIQSGETVGIIGSTGSGKTTLVQLIPRLFDVSSGMIKIGGKDVRDYDPYILRESISFVPQKNILFSGTVRHNMKFGNENATDDDIVYALKQAYAWDFLKDNPSPLDTKVEQNGDNFSGGQKQRLCIARALVKKSNILILDDSTSAVDADTDSKIQSSLKDFLPDITKIIISQKILSLQNCDKIVVMDEGKIESIGTNDYLIKNSEIYNQIYTSQMKGVMASE